MNGARQEECGLIEKHTAKHWLRYLGTFVLSILIGAYAVYLDSPVLALFELAAVGVVLLFVGRFLCTRCPYYGQACYFMAGKLVSLLFKKREGDYTLRDILAVGLGLLTVFGFPQYWLFKKPLLLFLFWLVLIVLVIDLHRNMCPRCKNRGCPSNRAP